MGATAAISVAASTAANAYSNSQAERAAGDYQKGISDTNSRLSQLSASDAVYRGEKEATEAVRRGDKAAAATRRTTKRIVGAQRAAAGAQGIDVNSGSIADVTRETTYIGETESRDIRLAAELDALTIKNNAYLQAWGYKVQADEYSYTGRIAALTAKNRARSTLVTGGLNAVTGGINTYSAFKGK